MLTPPKKYRIGEVAEFSRLSRQTIHNYTHLGLIKEQERTKGDHRLYDESVFARLERIKVLRKRHPLREIKRLLEREDGDGDPVRPDGTADDAPR